jgi:hypothetical protein
MIKKKTFSRLLRIVASTIDNLSEDEIEKLLLGKSKLEVVSSPVPKSKQESISSLDHQEIVRQLNDCKDRDEARRLLSNITSKDSLTIIAKSEKLHITKQDRREDIENKIIEFFIGAKLRTDAIQTLNMKGGSDNG